MTATRETAGNPVITDSERLAAIEAKLDAVISFIDEHRPLLDRLTGTRLGAWMGKAGKGHG